MMVGMGWRRLAMRLRRLPLFGFEVISDEAPVVHLPVIGHSGLLYNYLMDSIIGTVTG